MQYIEELVRYLTRKSTRGPNSQSFYICTAGLIVWGAHNLAFPRVPAAAEGLVFLMPCAPEECFVTLTRTGWFFRFIFWVIFDSSWYKTFLLFHRTEYMRVAKCASRKFSVGEWWSMIYLESVQSASLRGDTSQPLNLAQKSFPSNFWVGVFC